MNMEQFLERVTDGIPKGYVLAAFTDEYVVDQWPDGKSGLNGKEDKLLEIRVFDDGKEYKLSRSDIGKAFVFRSVCDSEDHSEIHYDTAEDIRLMIDAADRYDERQFLDIDEKKGRTDDGRVTTTGGGTYKLPLDSIKDAKLVIRYYLQPDAESGQARVIDWRVVGFTEG